MKIQINGWTIDEKAKTLYNHEGNVRKIGRHELKVLLLLVGKCDEVLSTDELLTQGWPEKVVSKNSLTQAIRNLRVALDDDGKEPFVIKTVNRVGYSLNSAYLSRISSVKSTSPSYCRSYFFISNIIFVVLVVVFFYSALMLREFYFSDSNLDGVNVFYEGERLKIYSFLEGEEQEELKNNLNDILELKGFKGSVYLLLSRDRASLSVITEYEEIFNFLIIYDGTSESEVYDEILALVVDKV